MKKKAMILDLDNTVYNWTDAFVESLHMQALYLSEKMNRKESTLLKYFKNIFKLYGTVEVPYAVEKLEIWDKLKMDCQVRRNVEIQSQNIFFQTFKNSLQLYPDVEETLRWAKENDIYIIGLSDSFSYWIQLRLEWLHLWQYFDVVYAQNNEAIRECIKLEEKIESEKIIEIESTELKPNTVIVNKIINTYNLNCSDVYMIGDSYSKDVFTAQESCVCDVWAKYGTKYKKGNGRYLGSVTPWTKEEREARIQIKKTLTPTFTIMEFKELKNIIK